MSILAADRLESSVGLRAAVALRELTEADLGFVMLMAAIGILVLCALLFAVTAGVLRYRNRRKEREWLSREARWEAPLLEVLSGAADPAVLWRLVERREELYFVDYLLRFARRMRGRTRRTLSELARPYLDPVVERISSGDTERRARAVETIALLDFDRHAHRILAALDDPSPLVCMIAARSIARNQNAEHVHVLLQHLAHLRDWSPRQLTSMLASIGPEATPGLRLAVVDASYPAELRAVAVDSLRRLHDPEAVQVAAAVLERATERDLIAACLRLVAELGGTAEAPRVRLFCTHHDPVIRAAAIQALPDTGLARERLLLLQGMQDESSWVAIQAARGLLKTGDAASLRTLARTEDPRSALARQVLVEAL